MKKYKSMILLVALFVAFFALYFIMGKMNEKQAVDEIEETIMVTDLDSLTSMEYTDGTTTLSFVKEDGAWKVKDNDEITLDSDSVESIANTLSQVAAVRVLEGGDELSNYGLDEPVYTITMESESGVTLVLYIGDAAGDNYYATTNDKVVIYTIGSSVVNAMEFDVTALEAEEETDNDDVSEDASDDTLETEE